MNNLKKNIIECQNSELTVVASVCDQGQTNVFAINRLVRERRGEDINSEDLKLYTLNRHDIAHMWEHILRAYLTDKSSGELRSMPKLTDFHVSQKDKKNEYNYK
jgi:hypothetical protein